MMTAPCLCLSTRTGEQREATHRALGRDTLRRPGSHRQCPRELATPSSGVGIADNGANAHTATRTDDHSIASYHAAARTMDRADCPLPSICTGGWRIGLCAVSSVRFWCHSCPCHTRRATWGNAASRPEHSPARLIAWGAVLLASLHRDQTIALRGFCR